MQIQVSTTANLDAAVLAVMQDIEVIGKNKKIGTGANAYQGVSDIDVKVAVRRSMIANKLVCYPIAIEPTVEHIYKEQQVGATTVYKDRMFTTVKGRYKIKHVPTGEFEIVEGYGHGVDSQDKSAGKAATYAMKSMLLYLFMIPTGELPDADDEHEEDLNKKTTTAPEQKTKSTTKNTAAAPATQTPPPAAATPPPVSTPTQATETKTPATPPAEAAPKKKKVTDVFIAKAVERISTGNEPGLITALMKDYDFTEEQLKAMRDALPKLKATLPGE